MLSLKLTGYLDLVENARHCSKLLVSLVFIFLVCLQILTQHGGTLVYTLVHTSYDTHGLARHPERDSSNLFPLTNPAPTWKKKNGRTSIRVLFIQRFVCINLQRMTESKSINKKINDDRHLNKSYLTGQHRYSDYFPSSF